MSDRFTDRRHAVTVLLAVALFEGSVVSSSPSVVTVSTVVPQNIYFFCTTSLRTVLQLLVELFSILGYQITVVDVGQISRTNRDSICAGIQLSPSLVSRGKPSTRHHLTRTGRRRRVNIVLSYYHYICIITRVDIIISLLIVILYCVFRCELLRETSLTVNTLFLLLYSFIGKQ